VLLSLKNRLNSKEHLAVKKNNNFKLLHGQKYAENCGSEALKLRCGATFLQKVS
jgi:hypothetical protein